MGWTDQAEVDHYASVFSEAAALYWVYWGFYQPLLDHDPQLLPVILPIGAISCDIECGINLYGIVMRIIKSAWYKKANAFPNDLLL